MKRIALTVLVLSSLLTACTQEKDEKPREPGTMGLLRMGGDAK